MLCAIYGIDIFQHRPPFVFLPWCSNNILHKWKKPTFKIRNIFGFLKIVESNFPTKRRAVDQCTLKYVVHKGRPGKAERTKVVQHNSYFSLYVFFILIMEAGKARVVDMEEKEFMYAGRWVPSVYLGRVFFFPKSFFNFSVEMEFMLPFICFGFWHEAKKTPNWNVPSLAVLWCAVSSVH